MKNHWIKLLFVVAITALCAWVVNVKGTRLGKDLKGGVSLVYSVKTMSTQPADQVIAQVIEVLKQRVNPQGVLDISMQPQGTDRIEVVMPLPSDEVRALQIEAKKRVEDFLAKTQLSAADLDAALASGTAASRFAKQNPAVADLESAWQALGAAQVAHQLVHGVLEVLRVAKGGQIDRQNDMIPDSQDPGDGPRGIQFAAVPLAVVDRQCRQPIAFPRGPGRGGRGIKPS